MYSSGNAPSFYAPGGMSGYDQEHFQTSFVYGQPPSQGDMNPGQGNSLNQFQGETSYRGLSEPAMLADNNTKPPSFTQVNSYNHDPNVSRGNSSGYSVSQQAPSRNAMVKVNVSHTSDGDNESYSKAPGISDVDQRGGSSETGASETNKSDGPSAKELMGISLVGKNFRKFYPNAYHREGDYEN